MKLIRGLSKGATGSSSVRKKSKNRPTLLIEPEPMSFNDDETDSSHKSVVAAVGSGASPTTIGSWPSDKFSGSSQRISGKIDVITNNVRSGNTNKTSLSNSIDGNYVAYETAASKCNHAQDQFGGGASKFSGPEMRNKRKSELTSLLVILFGLLTVIVTIETRSVVGLTTIAATATTTDAINKTATTTLSASERNLFIIDNAASKTNDTGRLKRIADGAVDVVQVSSSGNKTSEQVATAATTSKEQTQQVAAKLEPTTAATTTSPLAVGYGNGLRNNATSESKPTLVSPPTLTGLAAGGDRIGIGRQTGARRATGAPARDESHLGLTSATLSTTSSPTTSSSTSTSTSSSPTSNAKAAGNSNSSLADHRTPVASLVLSSSSPSSTATKLTMSDGAAEPDTDANSADDSLHHRKLASAADALEANEDTPNESASLRLSAETSDSEAESAAAAADEETKESDNKLADMIVGTAGEAADQIVTRLKPNSEATIGRNDDNDATDADEDTITNANEGDIEDSPKSSELFGSATTPTTTSNSEESSRSERSKRVEAPNALAISSNLPATRSTLATISPTRDEQLKTALSTYTKWRSTTEDLIELFSRKLLPLIVEHGYDVDAGTVGGLLQVFNALRSIKPWALKLIDASAKIAPGLLVGTQSDFGDFDECLNVRVDDPSGLGATANENGVEQIDPSTGLPVSAVVGRYCIADVEFPKPPRVKLASRNEQLRSDFEPIELHRTLFNFSESEFFKDTIFVETGNFLHMLYVDPIRVGICLTNKIDPENFSHVFNKLLEEFKITVNFHGRCVTKYDKPVWSVQQQLSAYLLLVACFLVALSTLMDVLHSKINKIPMPNSRWRDKAVKLHVITFKYRPLFTSFSIIRNTKRLFKPQSPSFAPVAPVSAKTQLALNLARANSGLHSADQINKLHTTHQSSISTSASSTSSSMPADSSVESSPSIERRGSTSTDGSAMNLIIAEPHASGTSLTAPATGKTTQLQFEAAAVLTSKPSMKTGKASSKCTDLSTKSSTSSNSIDMSARKSHQNIGYGQVDLLCLHGIRVITMTWMIVNHTYLFGGFFVLWAHRRLIDIAEWPKSLSFQLVLNGWLTVETYFFLSATIIVLNVMPLMKRGKFAYPSYILHRLIRLLPAYGGLVALNFLWPLVSSGPVWLVKGRSFIQTPCENYLWTNFLFINNWIWPEKQCMVHTWFLSADFQLYLLAPIIVYLLYKRPAFGHTVNLIVAIIASVLSGFVIYANKLLPTTLINKLEFDFIKQQLSYSYFATYQHMGPYCLGILTGYMMHKRPRIFLPKHLSWFLWLVLPPLSFTTLMLTYLWNGAYPDLNLINPSPLVSALYVAIHRTIWTSLVAWIVFACSTGRARMLSNFLSHSFFIPLSRLSFSIYLVHLPVIMFRALNLRHTKDWTDSNILWEACGNFIVSVIAAFFLNVTFESPIINLERLIFRRGDTSSPKLPLASSNCVANDRSDSYDSSDCCTGSSSLPVTNMNSVLTGTIVSTGVPTKNNSSANLMSLQGSSTGVGESIVGKMKMTNDINTDELTETDNKSSRSMGSSSPDEPSINSQHDTGKLKQDLDRRSNHLSSDSASLNDLESSLTVDQSAVNELSKSHALWSAQQQREMQRSQLRSNQGFSRDYFRKVVSSTQANQMEPLNGFSYSSRSMSLGRGTQQVSVAPRLANNAKRRPYQLETDSISPATSSSTNNEMHQQTKQPLSAARRLLAQELGSTTTKDDLYSFASEYQHYAPGSYQHWRMHSSTSNRPMQYATLARTNHIEHESSSMNKYNSNGRFLLEPRFKYSSSQLGGNKQQQQLMRNTNRDNTDLSKGMSNDYNRQDDGRSSHIHSHRPIVNARRQGRYNTLTNLASSRDHWNSLADMRWRQTPTSLLPTSPSGRTFSNNNGQTSEQENSTMSNWLLPGSTMILPRIDSSTLRRQSRLAESVPSTSIAEESISDEREDAPH